GGDAVLYRQLLAAGDDFPHADSARLPDEAAAARRRHGAAGALSRAPTICDTGRCTLGGVMTFASSNEPVDHPPPCPPSQGGRGCRRFSPFPLEGEGWGGGWRRLLSSDVRTTMRRLLYLIPVALFLALVGYFGLALRPGHDPSTLPSAMIDKPAPDFDLAGVAGAPGLSRATLHGHAAIVNFFASWCLPCRSEHPLLMRLAEQEHVPLFGIA